MVPGPHPLAGKSGEGPPIAPPNWRWRAGNRISDMYFYAPSGKQFRSRPELATYLKTLSNPPDANLFCWRPNGEVLQNGYIPRDDVVVPKSAKRKAESSAGGNKRIKTSPLKPLARVSDFAVQQIQVEPVASFTPSRYAQVGKTISSPTSLGPYMRGSVRKKAKCVRISGPHSFKSILARRSSFKWLYDSDTLEKFLEEAQRLKNKSAAEINEMRIVLQERDLDTNNICKYPNSVIRVFVRLLRNEEAPASMGKIELAHLCVNWKCKKRNYWCSLELGRINSPRKIAKVNDIKRGGSLSQTKGSVCHSATGRLTTKCSGNCNDRVTGYTNGLPNQMRGSPKLDFRLPDGSGTVGDDWTGTSGPTGQFQSKEGADFDNATTSRIDVEGISFEELALASSLEIGHSDAQGHSEIGKEAVGDRLQRTDPSGSQNTPSPQVECLTAVNHENDGTPFQRIEDRTQRMSEQCPSNAMYRVPSWDSAGISKAIDGSEPRPAQHVSEEPVRSEGYGHVFPAVADFGRQTGATELMPPRDAESVLPSAPAPHCDGESIIVITGFKSSSSKGTSIVYHGDEAAKLEGGSFAVDLGRFRSASENPSTSGREPSKMQVRASISVGDDLDSITRKLGYAEPGSSPRDRDSMGAFPCIINSQAMELTMRGADEHICFKQAGSTLNVLGVAPTSQVPESRCNLVQERVHGGEPQRSVNLNAALDDGGSQGDFTKTFVSDDVKLRMVPDPRTPTSTGNVESTAISTKNPSRQLLPAALRQEPLVSHDEDVSPTLTRHTAHFSDPIVAEREGKMEEHLNDGSREQNVLLTPKQTFVARDSFACWCHICGSDFSFCRGCMCSFCRKVLQPGEDWKIINCICNHVCHMDCALAANAAGVVKELGLDGELSCPSCSRKVDLWLFFKKRFDLILSHSEVANANLKGVEKLLFQAMQLLKGTEKVKYKSIEGLVTESYELLRKFPVLGLVKGLLRAVRDELHIPHFDPDAETLGGELGASATPQEMEWLKKERLAEESFYNAKNERLLMEQAVDKVHKAYEDALSKRKQARDARRAMIAEESQRLKPSVNPLVSEKQRISQQVEVDQELKKLWDMRTFQNENFTTIRALDASAAEWIESLKLQRAVVEVAQAKLQHLENLSSPSVGM